MSVATALTEELPKLGMTHQDFANLTHYSRQSVTAWSNGERKLPDDVKKQVARLAPRVAIELCAACPANIFTAGWLDGDVDLSMVATTMKLAEELNELAEVLRVLHLVNKNTPESLSEVDRQVMLEAWQEALDVLTGIQVWMVRGAQTYGLDLMSEAGKHRAKLINKRYKRKEPLGKAVT